ncbi:uncharacterized protein LOC129582187 [Paramacrobiotus metropolitanus]|uniref:uncharacterized protein LOC129582187 n=1 Tax=Paramacrobiotus metropolitanus TaxID=2943436 RepID=UPI00244570E3|nr:uncharacterized protein LOC129582187 [Paramacrobiotus metropolitanus]
MVNRTLLFCLIGGCLLVMFFPTDAVRPVYCVRVTRTGKGDRCSDVARANGLSVSKLVQINPQIPDCAADRLLSPATCVCLRDCMQCAMPVHDVRTCRPLSR